MTWEDVKIEREDEEEMAEEEEEEEEGMAEGDGQHKNVGERCPLRIHVASSSSSGPGGGGSSISGCDRPRREGDAALFLEKTYELLARCPSEVASWTAQGDSFVVKQPTAFAAHVIPTYFKHCKFSSFVRQLNLYGFKKVRTLGASGGLDTDAGDDSEGRRRRQLRAAQALEDASEWWEFRHERFVRGRRDWLCEIRRRSPCGTRIVTPRTSMAGAATTAAAAAATTAATASTATRVDRVEFDDLKAQVGGLRDEMRRLQWTNQQLTGLLHSLVQRCSSADDHSSSSAKRHEYTQPPAPTSYATSPSVASRLSLPSIAIPSSSASNSSSVVVGPQLALLQLRQGHPGQSTPRDDVRTPRTPGAGPFQLRPVQTLLANRSSPSGRRAPSSTSARGNLSFVSTPSSYSQDQLDRRPQRWYRHEQPSPSTCRSPLKRLRVDSATSVSDPPSSFGVYSPEDRAVRELSRVASEIRSDLLACITARITGFLRVHCDASAEAKREADVDAVGEAVGSDIRLKLAQLQTPSTADPMLLDVETTCMYRVEILKFISRELPRAVQEAVDKRMLAPERLKQRSAKERSQLALLVQKAQKALEQQMHAETSVHATGRR
ncbi:unnamed protein product [Hyaloperonospora brassicae]|uniref:HSF-type DNA-binding domain-containing protein n=1 Tax=Hyaloperonospora brassicae TaxID=162125 RepID=A0AAV0TNR7_HYABA|nr:unnamed protein product [Hyaloperonospora brassicae]